MSKFLHTVDHVIDFVLLILVIATLMVSDETMVSTPILYVGLLITVLIGVWKIYYAEKVRLSRPHMGSIK